MQATFLRSGNSGMTPFHFICGDAPEIVNALAMHKVAAVEELMNLFLAELEKVAGITDSIFLVVEK